MPGPLPADPRGPLLLQRGVHVQLEQVRQGDVGPDLDRLPGPLRQQARRDQPPHRVLQRVMVALAVGAVVVGAAGGGQRVQHRGQDRGALRAQIPGHHPGAAERGLQPDRPVLEPRPVFIRRAGLGVHLRGQLGQVPQAQPARRGPDQDRVGGVAAVLREPAGPAADGPCPGLGEVPGGQRGQDAGVGPGPAGPAGVTGRGGPGDAGPVDQPGPGTVVPVLVMALAGGERGQNRGPGGAGPGVGPLQGGQALGLHLSRHLRRIRGRQESQPGADHLQCLSRVGGRRNRTHDDRHLLPGCSPAVNRCRCRTWRFSRFPPDISSSQVFISFSCSILAAGCDILREETGRSGIFPELVNSGSNGVCDVS